MKKHFVLLFAFLLQFSILPAQVYNFDFLINSIPGDPCSREIEITPGGDFSSLATYHVGNVGAHFTTTSNHFYYCNDETVYAFDEHCNSIFYYYQDEAVGPGTFYISNVVWDLGGSSDCDNTVSFIVHGGPDSLEIILTDHTGSYVDGTYSSDSVFTFSGVCLAEWGSNPNLHQLNIEITNADTPGPENVYLSITNFQQYINSYSCDTILELNLDVQPATDMSTCNGVASATVSGGTLPVTITYSNGSTLAYQDDLCAGIYNVTAEDADGLMDEIVFVVPDSASIYYENPYYLPIDTLMSAAYMNCMIDFSADIDTIYIDSMAVVSPEVLKVFYVIIQGTHEYHWNETYYADPYGYYCFVTSVYCEEVLRANTGTFTAYLFASESSLGIRKPTVEQNGKIKIYPIPFTEAFTVELMDIAHAGMYTITLFDQTGRQLMEQETRMNKGNNSFGLNGAHLNSGIYYLQVKNARGIYAVRKIVK